MENHACPWGRRPCPGCSAGQSPTVAHLLEKRAQAVVGSREPRGTFLASLKVMGCNGRVTVKLLMTAVAPPGAVREGHPMQVLLRDGRPVVHNVHKKKRDNKNNQGC
eukprot:386218-Hanusia_phi.AAC.2